jgi:hypothetical protein
VRRAFDNIGGAGDFDDLRPELRFWTDVPDLNERVKSVIVKYAVPYAKAWDEPSRQHAKLAMSFVLTFMSKDELLNLFNSYMFSFPEPIPVKLAFQWFWDELFPGESWLLEGNRSSFEVVDDSSAPPPTFNPLVRIPNTTLRSEFIEY